MSFWRVFARCCGARSNERRGRRVDESKTLRYRFAGWELSLRTRRLTSPAGKVVSLTKGEFVLMAAFVQAPGKDSLARRSAPCQPGA